MQGHIWSIFGRFQLHDSTQVCRKCLSNEATLEMYDRYDKQESSVQYEVAEAWVKITQYYFFYGSVSCICCLNNSRNGWMSDTDNISFIILPVLFRHDVRTFCNYFSVFSAEKTAAKLMFFCHFSIGCKFSTAML